ncbi:hypothetical protein PR048_001812 [Dryococelus australis]|uniref:HAT C-terminal dimerisation domain-containing protein n=1 Tax=Dryococelus australis TaxID=614101 RepID=A0ABQ9IKW2_9NEOP|nr:hypothetical protein PR048_001812 [Dryococelus australis]
MNKVLETQEEKAEDEKAEPEEMSLWSAELKMAQPAHRKPTANVVVEYDSYMQEPLLNRKSNIYDWYRTTGKYKYPNIARVGAKYLPVPATSVAREQLFSSADNTVTFRRTLFSPEHIEQLSFLHDNLK